MHRILLSILFTTSLFAKDIIAVLDLEQIGLTPQEAQILTQRLTTKLISLNKYQVVERTNMDKILKEQKFQSSGCTDSECAVEIGQLLNTDFIVIGSVSKFGSMYSLDSRLIDVAQGKGLISAEFSKIGEIEILMSEGITSIANQLCGLQTATQKPIQTKKVNGRNVETFPNNNQLSDPEKDDQNIIKTKNISDIANKTWSFSIGVGTIRNVGVFQLTKDFKISDNVSFYSYIGLANVFGIGICYQPNYNETGYISAISYGIGNDQYGMGSVSVAKQWRRKNSNGFFSLGLTIYNNTNEIQCGTGSIVVDLVECPEGSVYLKNETMPFLVLGYDWRF